MNAQSPANDTSTKAAYANLAAQVESLVQELKDASPHRVMEAALQRYGGRIRLAFSGAEDVLLIDFAKQVGGDFSVFCLDTGRLHAQTYIYLDRVREHFGIDIDVVFPKHDAVQDLVKRKGLFSFYKDGHKECCSVRKVEPLRRILATTDAWATGQRRDQSPDTRADVPVVQLDNAFGSPEHPLVKFNPLAGWSSAQVWRFIRGAGIPYNPLHERGYVSIGCAPCTRAVLPGQHEREGRWWWELAGDKECGLHVAE